MKRLFISAAMLFSVACLQLKAAVEPIVLTSPDDYQVIAVSANGKWATGVYVDYSQNTFGFRWNLESNNIQLLSTTYGSYGNSVSDDGVVVGHFAYTPETGGAPYEVPGFYKDGEWHIVEMPAGVVVGEQNVAGRGSAITPDGTRMTGILYIGKSYTPFVWNVADGGSIVRQLDISNSEGTTQHGYTMCISPNGLIAGGWSYLYNRSNVLWDVTTGEKQHIGMTDHSHQGFNAYVSKFSPDGKKVIFGGGWDYSVSASSNTQWAYSIYDLETGAITELPTIGGSSATIALYGISNDYTVVGSNSDFSSGRAVIYKAAEAEYDASTGYYKGPSARYLDEYLEEQGVNLADYDMFYNPNTATPTTTMFRGQDISADGNVICALYYGGSAGEAALRSMIVMLNQDEVHVAPQDVSIKQMEGLNAVAVSWVKPGRTLGEILSYAIYRDGTKVATMPADATIYYDRDVEYGSHSYSVAAVYDDEETMSGTFAIVVRVPVAQGPTDLFLRQKGVNSIYAQWEKPLSNLINKSWYNPNTANLMGFGIGMDGVSIEMGVRFDKDEMALYEGTDIEKVDFYPMTQQESVVLNIYKYNADGQLELLYTQPVVQELKLRKRNTVVLTEAVDLPMGSDVVVAFSYYISHGSNEVLGMDYGRSKPGYGDLIRFVDEDDFYSFCDMRAQQGIPEYMTFMINMVLGNKHSETNRDELDYYSIRYEGEEVGQAKECMFVVPNTTMVTNSLSKTVDVAAVYKDGSTSEFISGQVSVAADFAGVENVTVERQTEKAAKISWGTPLDVDAFEVTYSGQKAGTAANNGVKGPAENNYGFMAGARYSQTRIKGYDGYNVKSFSFYPTGDATFTFILLKDGEKVNETPVFDYVLNEWNVVELDVPVLIDETSSYTLILDVYDALPGVSALALDNTTPFVGVGDMYSLSPTLDEISWNSIAGDTGLRGNWMIGMNLEETDPQPARVAGYDVYISKPGESNVRKVNADVVTGNEYVHEFADDAEGNGKVRVATYYEGRATVANPGTLCDYSFVFNSIKELVLNVSDVASYEVFAANGQLVRQGKDKTVDVQGLVRGSYAVKIRTASGKVVTQKVFVY